MPDAGLGVQWFCCIICPSSPAAGALSLSPKGSGLARLLQQQKQEDQKEGTNMKLVQLSLIALLVLATTATTSVLAGDPAATSGKSIKGRVIGLVAGAAGGFFLGWAISDDDAMYAEKKLATNIAIAMTACGAGGFLAGWAIDKRSYKQPPPDPAVKEHITAVVVRAHLKRLASGQDLTRINSKASGLSEILLPIDVIF
jgi:hypothetical protein